jgi:hypothetical protein
MAITKTDTGRVVLSNAEYVHVTPYVNEDTLGTTTYDIVDIVGDSLSFTPDDNTINAKESEFKDDPLFENVTLGKYQFAATCIDFQNIVMQHIYGWEVDENDNVYAPTGYKDKFALIEIGFRNEDTVVVAPKVKLNSKATIGSLKTGTGEGAMAGTAYTGTINSKKAPIAFLKAGKDEAGVATATYSITVGETASTFTVGAGVGAGA